jgi:diguanylate cyclase (GGDEF)-like protein
MHGVVLFLSGFVAASAAFLWRARRMRRPRPLGPGVAYDQSGRDGSPMRGVRASQLGSLRETADPLEITETRERELADELRGYLGDIGAQHGGADATFWVRRDGNAKMLPVAWNHPASPPDTFLDSTRDRSLIAWAAAQGVVTFDAGDGTPELAAARVPLDSIAGVGVPGEAEGALVVTTTGGIRSSRGDLKLWLPRHAERLAQLVELQVTRNESARQNRRMRVLVRRAQMLDPSSEKKALETQIADSILEATEGTFAALVEWKSFERRGTLRYTSSMYPEPRPPIDCHVTESSKVGGVCTTSAPQRWENAGAVESTDELYGPGLLVPPAGALAIVPMRRGRSIIGAIVVGSEDPRSLRESDLRTAGLFAQLAGSALEAAWEIEEVSRTARVDQLTGLGNRRQFDDELKRALDGTDRFGGECSLVLGDVDLFKGVNDTYGHAAGDKVLQSIALAMRELVRTTDVCARIGGEEFCLILPQTGQQGAVELAERVRARIAATTVRLPDRNIMVTTSFGVATYVAGGGAVKRAQLFDDADRALYQAKGDGRNCVRIG